MFVGWVVDFAVCFLALLVYALVSLCMCMLNFMRVESRKKKKKRVCVLQCVRVCVSVLV